MKKYEDYLTDAQQEIANYISSLSMKEYRLNNDTIERLQTILNNAIGYYVAVDKHINEIVNDTSTTDEEKRDRLVDLINSNYPYRWEGVKQLDREVVRLKDASKDVFNATIDWI
jgi:23S rRNA G2069 N7-methylase RlmK/C1962 C5-methylase RlmI